MQPANQVIIKKWKRWLKVIYKDLVTLAAYRHVFQEIQEIVRKNPKVNVGSSFHDLIATGYSTFASISVRRQLDRDRRSVSLALLMDDILKNPAALSRRRMVKLYQRSRLPAAMAHRHMDNSQRMGRVRINMRQVRKDLAALDCNCNRVRRYVNKHVAHRNRQPLRSLPTFEDLNRSIDFLEELFKRYNFLIEGSGLLHLTPTWQYDWKSVLRAPWISPEAEES